MAAASQLWLVAALLAGCVFDQGGLSSTKRDASAAEGASLVGDLAVLPDRAPDQEQPDVASDLVPDQAADQTLPPDKGAITPISTEALGNALLSTTVQCVLSDGQPQSSLIPVADSSSVSFFDGSVTLAGAPAATAIWVGGLSSVIVVWNPNACDYEDPYPAASWSSAGLLVRGATLGSGQLVLQPGRTIQDINVLNVNSDGTYQDDYFLPDDSGLSAYPHLVNPLTKAKELVLQLGNV